MNSAPYQNLIAQCELGSAAEQDAVISTVADFVCTARVDNERVHQLLSVRAYVDAALEMFPPGAIWRKYIDNGASVYAASPYNAKAQVRHDGFSPVPSLALCAALLRMLVAPILKAENDIARRAAQKLENSQ